MAEWFAWRCGLKRDEWRYIFRGESLRGLERGKTLICYGEIECNREWPHIQHVAAEREMKIVTIRRIQ
jgi:hypothetical protein